MSLLLEQIVTNHRPLEGDIILGQNAEDTSLFVCQRCTCDFWPIIHPAMNEEEMQRKLQKYHLFYAPSPKFRLKQPDPRTFKEWLRRYYSDHEMDTVEEHGYVDILYYLIHTSTLREFTQCLRRLSQRPKTTPLQRKSYLELLHALHVYRKKGTH